MFKKRAVFFSVATMLLLLPFSNHASAGEYYRDGYSHSRYDYDGHASGANVWYSSSCCYKRVTRHEGRYVRINPHWRHEYYEDHSRGYGHGYRYRPHVSYRSEHDYDSHYRGYRSYDTASEVDRCVVRRVRVLDGRGGWVWGSASSCY